MLFPSLLGSKNAQKKKCRSNVSLVFLIENLFRKAVEKAGRSEAPTRVDGKKKECTALPLNSCATGLSYTDHNVDHVD